MTGGSVSHSAGILSRANELERLNTQLGSLRQSVEEAAAAPANAKREEAAARYEVETAQAQRRAHEDTILTFEERRARWQKLAEAARRDSARRWGRRFLDDLEGAG